MRPRMSIMPVRLSTSILIQFDGIGLTVFFTFYTINVMWLHAFLTLWFEWSNLKSVVLFCSENPRCILIPDVNRATTMCTVQLYILNGSTTKSILSQLSSQVWPLWKVIMDHLSKNHLNMLYYCHYWQGPSAYWLLTLNHLFSVTTPLPLHHYLSFGLTKG